MSAMDAINAEKAKSAVYVAPTTSVSSGTYELATNIDGQSIIRFSDSFVPKAINTSAQLLTSTTAIDGAAPASVASLKGSYVFSYATLTANSFDGGACVEVVPGAEGDSIIITNFWSGAPVRAFVDVTSGKVTIPMQYLGNFTDVGKLYIAVVNSDGTVNKTAQIEGTVNADGDFDFSSWWGIFYYEGTNKDKLAAAYYNAKMARTNATMSFKQNDTPTSYGVRATQLSANLLRVENFFNKGIAVDFILNRDRTATISSQVAFINTYGAWTTIKCVAFNEAGNLTSYSNTIVTDEAAADNNKTITWTDWSLLTTGYYAGRCTETVLSLENEIKYPELTISTFEGDGTESNPYKISSLDHLVLLADKVNQDTAYVGTYFNNSYTRSFIGKYFEITNDIDMSGYQFEAIGSTWRQRFAGTLDGKGHTIKGLYVNGGADKYAGLFGICDTVSVFKNINLENPEVVADYYYAAPLTVWTFGDIANINVINPKATTNNGKIVAAGIVGMSSGKIENCHVTGGTIKGGGYVGAIAGEALGGMFNCSATGTTVYHSGTSYPVGGVVGNLLYVDSKNLYFNGTVRYDNYEGQVLGGVAGHVGACTLERSFFSGIVAGYSSDSYIGGVAGRLQGGNLINCYSTGTITGYSRKNGGIIGGITKYIPTGSTEEVHSLVRNCYTAAFVNAETYMYDKNECREVIGNIADGLTPTLENIYYDANVTNFYSTRFGSNTTELTSVQGPEGFDTDAWVFTAGSYPRIKGLEETPEAQYSAAAILFNNTDNVKKISANTKLSALGNTQFFFAKQGKLTKQGYYAEIVGDSLKISDAFGNDTLYVVNSDASVQSYHFIGISPIPFEGDGTVDSPFLIKTKDDLIALSEATTKKGQLFPDTYFMMTNDIDLEYDEAFVGINSDASDAHNQFSGVFDGNGYAIHKMKLDKVTWTTKPTATASGTVNTSLSYSYAGFIGRLATEGVLKNLTIADDADLTFYGTAGALVGYTYGRIENCKNYADVLGVSCWVGGITGQSMKESVIVNCYNAGNVVTYYSNAGGISGAAYGIIENCANTGNISAVNKTTNYAKQLHHCGGIAGTSSGSIIRNSINYGTVYAERDYAGGISGALEGSGSSGIGNDDVISTVNVGMAYIGGINAGTAPTLSKIGAIGGSAGTKKAKYTYWDAQLNPLKANGSQDVEGMIGVNTADLISGTPLDSLDAEIWDFQKGIYPALKIFANEEKVAAARKVILSIPEGNNAYDLHVDAILGANAKWSLAEGKAFSIEGSTLKSPAKVDKVTTDTLYAVNELGIVKPILIKSLPSNPLSGKGTAEEPYLINTVDEWNAFASFLASTSNDMTDQYVSLAADIDFTGKTLTRMANDGITPFAGTFDGNNHTVKGVALTMIATQTGAIFGTITGTLKNITFEGTQNYASTYQYTTGVVDKLYGTLDNVVSNMNVTANTASYTSGIVGYAYEGSVLNKVVNKGTITSGGTYIAGVAANIQQGVTLTDCGNEGTINYTGTSATAFVAGLAANVLPSTFTRCYNKGEIKVNTASVGSVAGLLANTPGYAAAPNYILIDCWNEADISASHKVAGLIAAAPTSSTNAANAIYTLTNCYNSGDISALAAKAVSSAPTAGLMTYYTAGSTLTNCYNTGNILSNMNVYAAGLLGSYVNAGTTDKPIKLTDCYNTGNIIADGNQGGGIMGYASGCVYFVNCYNTGDIEGNQMVGGIVSGFAGNSPMMTNCYNTGNITAKQYRAGGLISWGAPTASVIDGCWNTGNVSSTSEIGTTAAAAAASIGGLAGASSAKFINCYNAGTVSGLSQVGGLVGTPTKAKTAFENCYNAGIIIAPEDSCGSIVGVNTLNGKIWSEDNTVINTYYINTNKSVNDIENLGKPVSSAELAALDLGEAFYSVDNYTYPVVAAAAKNEAAIFNAAQLIVAEKDSYEKVTGTFYVGAPETVTWRSNCSALLFEGNEANFKSAYTGEIAVVAECGEYEKSYTIKAFETIVGIDEINADKEVIESVYFTTDGVQVPKPEYADGKVYIVIMKYADGSQKVVKLINK